MFRKTAWRNTVSDAVSFHQDQALSTTIFLLKSYGPTGFMLREEGEARNFKVCLGDPHTCTCTVFTKEQEPCKHICWVLLRKFRLPRKHEYSFQHGLVGRQILELLHGLHQTEPHWMENDPYAASGTPSQPFMDQAVGSVCRKLIQAQDVCPICQEKLLEKKQPVSHCRFGCGNNVHISCMKVWADHQKLSDMQEMVKCPLCRKDFSSLRLLKKQVKNAAKLFTAAEREKPDRHLGVLCHICQVCPIPGKCFKCIVCPYLYLCEDCSKRGCHPQHQFASRAKRRDKWRLVAGDPSDEPKGATSQRDRIITIAADPLPENVLGSLPTVRVRLGSHLLDEGQQCRICLQNFTLGQRVRTLPCLHKFHMDCVDGTLWKTNSCPLDGYVIYNPPTLRTSERKTSHKLTSFFSIDFARPEKNFEDLFVPGVALQDRKFKTAPPHGSLNLEVLTGSSVTYKFPQKLIRDQFHGFCITTTDAVTKDGKGVVQKKQSLAFPKSSSFDYQSQSDSGERWNTFSSKKTLAKSSSASPNLPVPVVEIREKPQVNLFVNLCRPEPGHTVTLAFPARQTRLQPRLSGQISTQDIKKRLAPELRMTGASINTQHHRKRDT